MEPVDTQDMEYIRLVGSDHWVVSMRPDDELASHKYIKKQDIIDKPLIIPERVNVQSELANWFGKDLTGYRLRLQVISEPMPALWQWQDLVIRYRLRVRQDTGVRICWCREDCILR